MTTETRVLAMWLLTVALCSRAWAEITLDGTMGPAGPLAGPNFTIADTVGTTVGTNLFHSFLAFNIDSTESATFTGPAGLDNVIGRVTGGTQSSIDGLFRSTVPGADVYFINPAGVVFGPNATLDVPAAFHASTADELQFTDTNVFSASDPAATVLTAAGPAAFGFLDANPAGLIVQDSALAVPTGAAMSLIGGDITIAGTDLNRPTPHLLAASGRLNLISVDAPGAVTKTGDALDAGGFSRHGDIAIADSRLITSGAPSGSVYIEGGIIVIDSSNVRAESSGPLNGGGIEIKGDTVVMSHEDYRNFPSTFDPKIGTVTSGSGDGGTVQVRARDLILDGGVRLRTGTTSSGRGGDVVINVNRLEILDTGRVQAWTEGAGRGGDIIVEADILRMFGPYNELKTGINTQTYFAAGDSGDIIVRAANVELQQRGFIDSYTEGGAGNSGNVIVDASSIEIRNASGIQSFNLSGTGSSRDVEVTADRIVMSNNGAGFAPQLNAFSFGSSGDVGDVTIRASSFEMQGALVGTATFDSGSGGDARVYVDTLVLDGGGRVTPPYDDPNLFFDPIGWTTIGADSLAPGSGPAGIVEIVADSIVIRGGASIGSGTGTDGSGGNIDISSNQIRIETQGRIDTSALASGPAGSIILNATDLILSEGGRITASSSGIGLAGDITVHVTNSIRISDGSVTTESLTSDGGNITLNAVNLVDLLNSSITTSVGSGSGAGGNINIDPRFVIVQNSQIIANAFGGSGGNINIVAGLFLVDPTSVISASSALGLDGVINVDSPVADVTSGVTELPTEALDASTLVQAQCTAQVAGTSSLTAAGREGLPAGPDGYLPSPMLDLASGSAIGTARHSALVRDRTGPGQALRLAMTGLECK